MLSFYAVDDYLTCPLKFKLRPRAAGPARAAPRADLWLGAPQGGPGVPSAPRPRRRDDRGRADRGLRAGVDERGLPDARPRGGATGRRARCAPPVPRRAAASPGRVIPAYVEREFSFSLGRRPGPRPLGPGRHRAGDGRRGPATSRPRRRRRARTPTPSSPTLGLTGRERVTITDYKSSDVRDPVKARQRARESLQLQIYAMGYEALTGRLPDCLQLHFLDSGLVGRVEVDPKRLAKAREQIAVAAAGMRARDYTREAGPDGVLVLPVPGRSARRAWRPDASRTSAAISRDHVRLRQHARPGRPGRRCGGSSRRPAEAVVARLGPFELDAFLAVWAEERERQFREEVPAVPRGRPRRAVSSASSRGCGAWAAAAGRRALGPGGGRAACRSRTRSPGRSTSTAAPSSRSCRPTRASSAMLARPGRRTRRWRSCRTGRSRRRSIATPRRPAGPSPRGDRRQPAGRHDQAAPGDLRGGRGRARRPGSRRRSSTSATTGRPTSSARSEAGWRAAYRAIAPRGLAAARASAATGSVELAGRPRGARAALARRLRGACVRWRAARRNAR